MGAKSAFEGFDFEGFWDDNEYSLEKYVEPAPNDELIASIENELGGFRLPAAYVELARMHNGGMLKRKCHPMNKPTGWAEDHIAITGLYAIATPAIVRYAVRRDRNSGKKNGDTRRRRVHRRRRGMR